MFLLLIHIIVVLVISWHPLTKSSFAMKCSSTRDIKEFCLEAFAWHKKVFGILFLHIFSGRKFLCTLKLYFQASSQCRPQCRIGFQELFPPDQSLHRSSLVLDQPWEYSIAYWSKPEISNLFTESKSIEYWILHIEYRWHWKIVIFFVFFSLKSRILRPKTHNFGSLRSPDS